MGMNSKTVFGVVLVGFLTMSGEGLEAMEVWRRASSVAWDSYGACLGLWDVYEAFWFSRRAWMVLWFEGTNARSDVGEQVSLDGQNLGIYW